MTQRLLPLAVQNISVDRCVARAGVRSFSDMGSAAGKPTLDLTDTSIVLHVPADEEKLTRIAEHLTSHVSRFQLSTMLVCVFVFNIATSLLTLSDAQRKSISAITAAGCALTHTQLGALLPLIFQCPRLVELDVSDNQLDSSRGWWPVCYALQARFATPDKYAEFVFAF